jgi:EmrB/QacA subfamily drug resistance transporter
MTLKRSKMMIFIVTALANLVAPFSINSVNLALPLLAVEFHASQAAVSWLTLVYSLVPSCALLFFGRLADIYGYRRQFFFGFVFFGMVSFLAPLVATSLGVLIFFRCLQGLGYAALISITQGVLAKTFDPSVRGRVLGTNAVFVSVGLASGPTIGGLILRHFTWHYIFYFSVPFCIIGAVCTLLCMKDDAAGERFRPGIDWHGTFWFSLCIGLLVCGVHYCWKWGVLSFAFTAAMLASSISFAAFVSTEKRVAFPLMPLGLLKNRIFNVTNAASAFSYASQQMTIYLMPFLLIGVLSLSPDAAGLIMISRPLVMVFASPFGGVMTDRLGTKPPALLGLAMIMVSCLMMSFTSVSSSKSYVTVALLVMGIGCGYSVSAINTAILHAASPEHAGAASGMLATMRNIGQTFGVTFGSLLLTLGTMRRESSVLTVQTVSLLAQKDAFRFAAVLVVVSMLLVTLLPKKQTAKM